MNVTGGSGLDAAGTFDKSESTSGLKTYTLSVQGGIITSNCTTYILPAISSSGQIASLLGTPTKRQYVYQIDMDSWTEFTNMTILAAVPITGGSETDNLVLILDSSKSINKYPGTAVTSEVAEFRTKQYYLLKALVGRVHFAFTGFPNIASIIFNEDFPSPYYKTNVFSSITSNKWRWVKNGKNRARAVEFTILDATVIESIIFEYETIGR